MRQFIFQLLLSCRHSDSIQKELELKEKEFVLKEREISLREKEISNQKVNWTKVVTEVSFKSHTPCSFTVRLPSNFIMQPMDDDKSSVSCHCSVKTKKRFEIIQLHSLLSVSLTIVRSKNRMTLL